MSTTQTAVTGKAVAEKLLQAGAVKLNEVTPFTWASGWKSPIYCDNRKVLSFPVIRDFIKSEICAAIFEQFPEAESLAAVATAGIAWGALAADQLKLPFLYVRPKPKEHGLGNQVEGNIMPGKKVLVIEDLVSTGKSSLQVCEVLREAEMEVIGMLSIFNYGFPHAARVFEEAGIRLLSLTDYENLIRLAVEKKIVNENQLKSLLNWREDPSGWRK